MPRSGLVGKVGRPRRYPWEKWFRQSKFTLIQGRDYDGRTDTMAQQVRNAALPTKHNRKIRIRIADDVKSLTVWVLGPYTVRQQEAANDTQLSGSGPRRGRRAGTGQ